MSRLIIKNLPSYITPARLKDHFTRRDGPGGTLTDVKVAQKQDGTSRRFAFVGFKTEEEAKKAQEWFDRTYIDTTRISVQVTEKDPRTVPEPRPNKKPRFDTSRHDEHHDPSPANLINSNSIKDRPAPAPKSKRESQYEEFMHVMQPRTNKERTWANEDAAPGPTGRPSAVADVLMKDMDNVSSSPNNAHTTAEDEQGSPEQEGADVELDDLEWMKRRMTKQLDLSDVTEKEFIQDDEDGMGKAKKPENTEPIASNDRNFEQPSPSPVDMILQTGRLFLRNLAFSCTGSDLEAYFSPYGTISQAHVPLDPITKTSKGLAFVTFSDPKCAVKAFEELDKTSFQGRLIHILPAVDRKGAASKVGEENNGKTNLKGEKEKKRKENASREFNWSMLYMNADAVASSIADRMNVPKADILNPEATDGDNTSAAVKLALAETHIIQETKLYLESEGIDLSAFSSLEMSGRAVRPRRSDTSILVKNIPYGTTAEQIRELFEPHGELSRVLVPPAGTIAVVDFVHADEAAKGFKAVAYRRMGSSIIYLEKAPIGIFNKQPHVGKAGKTSETTPKASSSKQTTNVILAQDASVAEDDEAAPGSTLFVKNLAFATSSERLTSVFRHLPSFAFARVQTKPDPKHPAVPGQPPPPRLSMGFGFVGFKAPEAAKKALSSMQGFVLDGHTLSVKFAGRGAEEEKSKEKVSATTTKMIVKNVPFEATKKDIRELFGAHGQLKSVRLPKKFDARSRGFAFLDFVSRHEAENAYAALHHTHLLGRHLVLEWAEDAAHDVEHLRKKAGVGYGDGAELPGRKRKLELREDDEDDGPPEP